MLTGLLFGLWSSICWAALDTSRKKLAQHTSALRSVMVLMGMNTPILIPLVIAGALWSSSAPSNALFDAALHPLPSMGLDYLWRWGGSLLLNIVANLLFMAAVRRSPLSLTIPYLAFTPAFTAILSLIIYQEVPSAWGWAGIFTIVLGAFFLNSGAGGPMAVIRALWRERGSVYMVIVAMLWSITPMFDKDAARLTNPVWHTTMLNTGLFLAYLLILMVRREPLREVVRELRVIPGWVILSGAASAFAMTAQLAAYKFVEIAYVETLKRAVGVLAAMGIGYFVFHEGDIRRRLVGAVVMLAGVAMILLGG